MRLLSWSGWLHRRAGAVPADRHRLPVHLPAVVPPRGKFSRVDRESRRRHDGHVTLARSCSPTTTRSCAVGCAPCSTTIDGFEVVGEAADGEAAVREAQLLRPDVVLMDVRMPGSAGSRRPGASGSDVPDTAVLMLTMYDDDATVLHRHAGRRPRLPAQGCRAGGDRRRPSARSSPARPSSGRASPAGCSATSRHRPRRAAPTPFPELTERERDILDLLADGLRTAAIAEQLYLSPKTVSNHLTSVFAKLEVADRAEAIIRAREGGLGQASRDRAGDPVPARPGGVGLRRSCQRGRPARAARARGARAPRSSLVGAGLVTASPWLAGGRRHATVAVVLLVTARRRSACPLALLTYPRIALRRPVDFAGCSSRSRAGVVASVARGTTSDRGRHAWRSSARRASSRTSGGGSSEAEQRAAGACAWMSLGSVAAGLVGGVVAFAGANGAGGTVAFVRAWLVVAAGDVRRRGPAGGRRRSGPGRHVVVFAVRVDR